MRSAPATPTSRPSDSLSHELDWVKAPVLQRVMRYFILGFHNVVDLYRRALAQRFVLLAFWIVAELKTKNELHVARVPRVVAGLETCRGWHRNCCRCPSANTLEAGKILHEIGCSRSAFGGFGYVAGYRADPGDILRVEDGAEVRD